MSDPIVSVLMTAYNREHLIGSAIESVLSSTLKNFELIIVDDLSKDGTFEVAIAYASRDARVKVYRNERNLGDYVNRNKAASYATGRYIKYLDSDDLIYPFGLDSFVGSMEKYPDAALGICSGFTNLADPFPIYLNPEQAYYRHFFEHGLLDKGPSGTIQRREAFEKEGGFSGARYIGDQELWLRLASKYPVLELHATLIFWRKHEEQEYVLGQGVIDEGYFLMELPMLRKALESEVCPLSRDLRDKILERKNKEYVRKLIKHVLRTGELKKGLRAYQKLGLSVLDVF